MCHLILAMPLLGLAVFWLLPLSIAGPAYVAILAVSAWAYYFAIKSMRRPVVSGRESLLRSRGTVIGEDGSVLRVRTHSEIWNAESADRLRVGDPVEIVGIDGLMLKVRRMPEQGREPQHP